MRYLLFSFLVFSFLLLLVPPARAEEKGVIGTILEVEGTATIQTPGGDQQLAALNSPVHLNDIVETGSGARVFILFIDDTQMVLSEKTRLYIDEYVFDKTETDRNSGVYSVFSGAFQYVSGFIAKKSNPDVTINTPVGSIGIRGTELWAGDIDGEYGVFVDDGAVEFTNEAGEAYIQKGEGSNIRGLGYAPTPPKAWKQEKLQKARNKVFLKNREQIKQRLADFKKRHPELQDKYKTFLKNRREKMRERKLENEERRHREQQWDDTLQVDGPYDLRMDVSPHENRRPNGPQKELREKRQDMREERRENRPQRQDYNR